MKRFIIAAAAAALLGGTALSTAQTQNTQSGQEEIIKKKPNVNSATEVAPGQQQKSGEAGSAMEVAPGQQQKSGDTTAEEAAPGQVKKEDQATGEQPKTNESASQNAPGQMQKSGEADSAAEAAPGQQQKSGEVENANEAAPGQAKKTDQTTDQTKPSSETTGSIDISAEQRTQIRDVIVETKAEPVNIDFEVNVGVVVPRTVTLRPLPPRVIEIVPAYRNYEYFVLADGRIIIVEPATLRVVYVLVV